jgi:hypothetical protein
VSAVLITATAGGVAACGSSGARPHGVEATTCDEFKNLDHAQQIATMNRFAIAIQGHPFHNPPNSVENYLGNCNTSPDWTMKTWYWHP